MSKTRKYFRTFFVALLLTSVADINAHQAVACQPLTRQPALRRPNAMVAIDNTVFVGNSRRGTVSVIDTTKNELASEHRVASRLSTIAKHPGKPTLLALDDQDHRLLSISLDSRGATVDTVAKLPPFPTRIAISEPFHRVFVTSLWSRKLTILSFDRRFEQVIDRNEVDLTFPPREIVPLDNDRAVVVTDAFSGRLTVVDTTSGARIRTVELPAHNIRGLAVSGDGSRLYMTHQILDPKAWAIRDDVHWGILMKNVMRVVSVRSLLNANTDPMTDGWVDQLGLTGKAAGDPGPVLEDQSGRLIVAISGVNELSITAASYATTVRVGRRPSGLCAIDHWLYVANQLDDSVTAVDLRDGTIEATISLGPQAKLSARDRGEQLFFDARLSHDRWMSCHSCHSDGHTIDRLADTLGDGGYGAAKRIPSLLGAASSGPWGWTAGIERLSEQVRKSVLSTMHGDSISERQTEDLVAYLESLQPPPSHFSTDTVLVDRGRRVFNRQNCDSCHPPPSYTSRETYDVGLADATGRRRFNPPSLLGLGQRDAFFHDGQVTDLEDLVRKTQHQLDDPLDTAEAAALLAFLKSL